MRWIQAVLQAIGSIFGSMLDLAFNGSRSLPSASSLDPHWEHEQLLKRLEEDGDSDDEEAATITEVTSDHSIGTDDPYFESNSSNL